MTVETERTEGMKALTLHRPWSFAVARLGKGVENRGWRTNYRGLLAIHAGQRWDWNAADVIEKISGHSFLPWEDDREPDAQRGIVAVASLIGCHFCEDDGKPRGFWSPPDEGVCSRWGQRGAWHWVLADVAALPEPVPCKGRQGMWTLPADVEREVRAQMEAAR